MSHVANIKIQILDLDCLRKAAARIGMEFREGQTSYKWFGRSVGDYPIPAGFKASDMGHCEHAISVPGSRSAYEVGIVRRRDGQEGYLLQYDFYADGYGLQRKIGKQACNLVQAYATEVACAKLTELGFSFTEETDEAGVVTLTALEA